MKISGNVALVFALLLFIYHLIPDLPALRAAIMRSNNGPLGAAYVLGFVLIPQFLRIMIATLAMWALLMVAMTVAVRGGGLDWLGIGRLPQWLLIGAACFAMTEISVLGGFNYDDPNFFIPGIVRAISPWAGWVLPLIVMGFALVTNNPSLVHFPSPWIYRAPLLAAFVLALPIGATVFVRWITPPVPVAGIIP